SGCFCFEATAVDSGRRCVNCTRCKFRFPLLTEEGSDRAAGGHAGHCEGRGVVCAGLTPGDRRLVTDGGPVCRKFYRKRRAFTFAAGAGDGAAMTLDDLLAQR